jgi:glycine cleavage system H protein
MNVPENLKYAKTDEWVKIEGNVAVIGVSDFAQEQLSDVVFVEIALSIGEKAVRGTSCATIESVKAAADVNSPVSGDVIEINDALSSSPELINTDPYGNAWMLKVKMTNPAELNDLMDSTSYTTFCEGRH